MPAKWRVLIGALGLRARLRERKRWVIGREQERLRAGLAEGWKPLYLPLLRQLEPAFSPGCLVIADDVVCMPDKLGPYLAYVREAANGYVSSLIPIHDGLELSIR